MAEEFHLSSGNLWDLSSRNRFHISSNIISEDPNSQMMGLGLSSHAIDWNQIAHEKAESSFGSMVDEDMRSKTSVQMDSAVLQGLLGSGSQPQQCMHYQSPSSNYGMNNSAEIVPLPCWSKVPQFLSSLPSPPKQAPHDSQLNFYNNGQFGDASAAAMNVVRSSCPPQTFHEKTKNPSEVGKKSSNETSTKRPRIETIPSPLPDFKVRKEKMGDRITALQQLVSPFGKTDTSSVLSEAIEYIKFLHEQVSVLSTSYMKSGAPIQLQKDPEGEKPDLRSHGLCLVPLSSTYPVTHGTTVDFWNPTFGGTFR